MYQRYHRVGPRHVRFLEYWFALNVALWICWITLRLRRQPLPKLLSDLSSKKPRGAGSLDSQRVVSIVKRVCRLRLFQLPMFPRICLRQSLALYRFLRGKGYPVQLHVGVHKEREFFRAHSWVSLRGEAIAGDTAGEKYRTLFVFPLTVHPVEQG